ncbi:MAG: aspartate aminotransferase family protein [Cellvibrionales bacterium TMED47]|nr:aspartate aminotransferase family protein [Porticoccaceae bacterium]RPG83188.1 MAG: aspartate aminotransferase family protein [Cellvibrionales bacterium TMED47]|tara:strand:+ start:1757 stop:2929 length:1173 start_codon:yes stop_codon:yes gene_type:complete
MGDKSLMNTYGERAATLVGGQGASLYDEKGKKYLDALSGIAVCGLGHSHPQLSLVISEQASKLMHCSNFFSIPSQQQLAKKLCQISGMTNVFFSNSGAEANEAAIKIARLHGNKKGIKLPTVLVMDNAFHGRTLATLTASGSRKIQAGFEPLVSGFVRGPFNDIEALRTIADNNPDICAVFVEPIQGEGGINLSSPDYLKQLRDLCDELDWLLMLDEVQTGNGRTGKYFYHQHSGVTPDVITTAKGLGNGMPIGACLASGNAAHLMQPGNHGSTFGGNPLACSVALKVVELLESGDIYERATAIGDIIMQGLASELKDVEHLKDIRGCGCMIGVELTKPCKSLYTEALKQGLIINVTAESVIRLLPPMIMTDQEAHQVVSILAPLIKDFQ